MLRFENRKIENFQGLTKLRGNCKSKTSKWTNENWTIKKNKKTHTSFISSFYFYVFFVYVCILCIFLFFCFLVTGLLYPPAHSPGASINKYRCTRLTMEPVTMVPDKEQALQGGCLSRRPYMSRQFSLGWMLDAHCAAPEYTNLYKNISEY